VDVSFLLDAPAGKDGFVKVQNGHLATGDGHYEVQESYFANCR
jgi:hypothetical protein